MALQSRKCDPTTIESAGIIPRNEEDKIEEADGLLISTLLMLQETKKVQGCHVIGDIRNDGVIMVPGFLEVAGAVCRRRPC